MSEIFLDIETTGLSFRDGHKIVEIACIETNELIPTNKVFHKLINPERNVPDEAYKIHGFSSEFLKDKPKFLAIADEFIDFIKDYDLIIHNAPFDLPFINHELKSIKKNSIKNKIIDSLELDRGKYPGMSNSVDALCRRFDIDLSKRTKHNALLDCDLLREVYINLLDVREPKLIFNSSLEKKVMKQNKIDYSKKVIKITNSELESHKSFLKSEFKKNYF